MPVLALIASAAFLTTLAGGLLARKFYYSDHNHHFLGLAGGLMLGVVAFDIIPESVEMSPSLNGVSLGMVALLGGFLLVHLFESITGAHHSHEAMDDKHPTHPGVYALIAHSFIDGAAIGLAFNVDQSLGWLVAIAVLVHDMADGFNVIVISELTGDSRKGLSLLVADALAPVAGILAASSVTVSESILGPLLGLFGGSLLYLATNHIIPEAHSKHIKTTFVSTAAGIALMFGLIGLVAV